MNLVVLKKASSTNLKDFIKTWSKLYTFSNEAIYNKSIVKQTFTKTDIQDLYVWKNGMKLSVLKQKSLDTKIKAKLSIINTFKSNNEIDIDAFRKEFKNLPATVWKIFLLHIIKPYKYPIYDQHIHRAFLFIHNEDWSNISNTSINNKAKEQFYFERYLPFIEANNIKDLKKLDEAFFAFGQFLNTRNYSTLLQ
ncbi:hypothetical protein BZARG_1289 [Bizionia argentinensis JUB59]|uniref:Uncharacterized protein n=1 Tax=Bizionia argentinensis JUB59 TaxID=1046627 RepID=G2EDE0_9FLAO|nr:hypothetical protein [Bizionia argentinensis]EGV43523.2 hypothetical protein BZARG_1289 [Bizionia argentinensis JUB59]